MIKNLKRILLITIIFLMLYITKSLASSISVSVPGSVSPGQSYTATITGNDVTGSVSVSVSGGSASTSSVWVENGSASVTITAGSSGTVTVNARGTDVSNSAGSDISGISGSGSSSIAANSAPAVDSSDDYTPAVDTSDDTPRLTNLGINPHDFSGFRSANTSYSVNVPNDCTSVNIYATGNGSISGTGTKTLKEGTNRFDITVSLNGSSKTYTLSIVRGTASGEDVPNSIDEEKEEENEGIVLEDLKINGYELTPKFDKKVFEYKVKVDKKFKTIDEIKDLVKPTFKDEKYKVEVTSKKEFNENENEILFVIKDDEREYARYMITFIYEAKETDTAKAAGIVAKSSNDDNDKGLMTKITTQSIILIVAALKGIFVAFIFAIYSYILSRKIRKYEDDEDYEEDEEENNELSPNSNYSTFDSLKTESEDTNNRVEEIENDDDSVETIKDAAVTVGKLSGYRNARKGRASGRHF